MDKHEYVNDHIAIFEGEEAKTFLDYAQRESTEEEKARLKDDLYFYLSKSSSSDK